MPTYTLKLNGSLVNVDAAPEMPLLWVLRDLLGMTGTKFSCGEGLCGACTVILDGEATRSCITPVSSVGEKALRTIEGLSEDGDHPVQRAWQENHVPQCGYCQVGQIMTTVALLEKEPALNAEEVLNRLDNNLCRCGTYLRIRQAVTQLVEEGGV